MLKSYLNRKIENIVERRANEHATKEAERYYNFGYTDAEIERQMEWMWTIHGENAGA